jgi:polyhydroxybutyrate depolymerase
MNKQLQHPKRAIFFCLAWCLASCHFGIRSRLAAQEIAGGQLSEESPQRSGGSQLTAGDHTRTLRFGDRDRRYLLHIPKLYDPSKAAPVVLVFHGGGSNPEGMIRLAGMNSKSDEAGFLVVYPYGTGPLRDRLLSFNGGECCAYAMEHQVDDVGFTRAILDDLSKITHVDSDRVFATGLSNGAIMSHYLASELSDRIAAIAAVGGPLMMEKPRNQRPVSVLQIHGTKDNFAPYQGGFGEGFLGRNGVTKFRSVDQTIRVWREANGCSEKAEVTDLPDLAEDGTKVRRHAWTGGRSGSEVVLVEVEGGGHTWPGRKPIFERLGISTMDVVANDLIWEFFQRHPRVPLDRESREVKP